MTSFTFLPFEMVDREVWGANKPVDEGIPLTLPAAFVIHTYTDTDPCFDRNQCIKRMRYLQAKDLSLGLSDIRFNFVVGGDSSVYVGRGWSFIPDMNEDYPNVYERSIEIAHFGIQGEPSEEINDIVKHFLRYATKKNKLKSNYKYIKHFQEILHDEEHFQLDDSGEFELISYKKQGIETEKEESDDYKVLADVSPKSQEYVLEHAQEENLDLCDEEYYDIADGIKVDGSLLDPKDKEHLKASKSGPSVLDAFKENQMIAVDKPHVDSETPLL